MPWLVTYSSHVEGGTWTIALVYCNIEGENEWYCTIVSAHYSHAICEGLSGSWEGIG